MKVHFDKSEIEELLSDLVSERIHEKCVEKNKGWATIVEIGDIKWGWTKRGVTAKTKITRNERDC